MKTSSIKKAPNPHDRAIGERIRARRNVLGMSQTDLGGALGLTFQQVQKYEKGANRVGGSRMQQIARVLKVSISFLHGETESGVPDDMAELNSAIKESGGMRLIRAFIKIASRKHRMAVVEMAEALMANGQ